MSAVIAIVVTVLATAPTVALASGLYIYIKFACPAISQARRYYGQLQETEIDLADERRTRADILKWIEHECRAVKAYNVESALKQRIEERLEVLRQLRLQRQQIRQV